MTEETLAQAGLVLSMSRRAYCYDNASMEGSWSSAKLELVYQRVKFESQLQSRASLFRLHRCVFKSTTRSQRSLLSLTS